MISEIDYKLTMSIRIICFDIIRLIFKHSICLKKVYINEFYFLIKRFCNVRNETHIDFQYGYQFVNIKKMVPNYNNFFRNYIITNGLIFLWDVKGE